MTSVNAIFYNEQAEKSVLALLMADASTKDVIPQLTAQDFYLEPHRKLFAAIQGMYAAGKQIDLITLSESLREMYGEEEPQLTDAMLEIASAHSFERAWAIKGHVEIIRAAAMRRRLYEILNDAQKELTDETTDTAVILDKTRQAMRDMVVTGHAWMSMADVMIATFDALERRAKGEEPSMPSGVQTLDGFMTGFHRGELTIIGARPAVGKSAFGAHIALSTAAKGYKVGICAREMTDVQYGTRILARDTEVDANKLRTGNLSDNDWQAITDALGLSSNLNVSFMFSIRFIEDLRMEVQKKVDAGEMDMLVVDYLQLMQTKQKFDKDYLRIGYISKMLKDMTVDYNISVIALAQVGRQSQGNMPTLSELRGSGDIEQDADNVIFMHRPENASDTYVRDDDKALFLSLRDRDMQYLALSVAKQRQGKTGTVPVVFNPARMRFMAIDRRDAQ